MKTSIKALTSEQMAKRSEARRRDRAPYSADFILLHQGAFAEQFVGQELLAYSPYYREEELYYWQRDKLGAVSEVDYVTAINSSIYPIEVKAGSTDRLKSLQMYIDEKGIDFGIRISQNPLSIDKRILSIPLYRISQLPRLINEVA